MSALGDFFLTVVALSSLILAHEFGHFIFARAYGVRVVGFSIGLGRELAGLYDRFGTRWSVSAIPVAGFMRFYGAAGSREVKATGIPYDQASTDKRLLIVLAGPLFSLLLAYFLNAAGIYWYPNAREPVIGSTVAGGSAETAGLQARDRILSVDGARVRSFSDVQEAIQNSQGRSVTLVIQRSGVIDNVTLTPQTQTLESERRDCLLKKHVVGIISSEEPHWPSFVETLEDSAIVLGRMVYQALYQSLITLIPASFQTCAMTVPGPLMRTYTQSFFLSLMMALSLSFAIMNLLPLPFLDGAELLFCLAALIRGKPLRQRTQDRVSSLAFWSIVLYSVAATLIPILR